MSNTNSAINGACNAKPCLKLVAAQANTRSQNDNAGCSDYPLNAVNYPFCEARTDQQVREDKGFYIPDFLSDKKHDDNPEAYSAAMDHAKHLLIAEGLLDDALNLVGLMLASIGEEGDSRAMQAEAALKVIEKKVSKARNRIDKHDTRHTNLFIAYFDLKHKASESEN